MLLASARRIRYSSVCALGSRINIANTRQVNYRFYCSNQEETKKKITTDEVPHPQDFLDGDPMPQLREGLSNGVVGEDGAVSPDLDALVTDITKLNMVELVQVNYLICKKLGIDPDILSIIKGALESGAASGGSAAAVEEAPAVVDTGFRSVIIRTVPSGVKERFPIMKLMRAEDEKLSLADVC